MHAVITGATSGIGRATAKRLAQLGYDLFLVGRNRQRGKQTLSELKDVMRPGKEATLEIADFSERASIHSLAQRILGWRTDLQLLINNAGIVEPSLQLTVDGIERTLAVNHIAPFLLTRLLLPGLDRGAPARIVTVTSQVYARQFDPSVHDRESEYRGLEAYRQSKLDNLLMTYSLARRLDPNRIIANCLHPGVVDTPLLAAFAEAEKLEAVDRPLGESEPTRARGSLHRGIRWIVDRVRWRLMPSGLSSPEQAAEAIVHLAHAPELAGVSGAYFDLKKRATPTQVAVDDEIAERLWIESERLAELESWPIPSASAGSHPVG